MVMVDLLGSYVDWEFVYFVFSCHLALGSFEYRLIDLAVCINFSSLLLARWVFVERRVDWSFQNGEKHINSSLPSSALYWNA